jgi:hypothetical protein
MQHLQELLYQTQRFVQTVHPQLTKPKTKQTAKLLLACLTTDKCQLPQLAKALQPLIRPDTAERGFQRFLAHGTLCLPTAQQHLTRFLLRTCCRTQRRLFLIVDETALNPHRRLMVVALATHNRALPLAWRAYDPNHYPPEGQVGVIRHLLQRLAPAIPAARAVVVLLDRGLGCSPLLLAQIAQMGWYFVARVPGTVHLRGANGTETTLRHWMPKQGAPAKRVYGAVFKKAGWHAYWVLGYWAQDAREPWLLVSNHPQAQVAWYRRRMAIEALFRDIKSGGWDFGRSRLRVVARIERLWWVLALALVWAVRWGRRVWRSGVCRRLGWVRGRVRRGSWVSLGLQVWRCAVGRAWLLRWLGVLRGGD